MICSHQRSRRRPAQLGRTRCPKTWSRCGSPPTTRSSTCRSSSASRRSCSNRPVSTCASRRRYADREKDSAEKPVMARLKEQLFDCGSADSYNVCEWASIDRLEKGKRGGNIAALRAAVAAQAIITFDEKLQVPRDLADVPVVVQELTGSHYTTVQMLESAVGARACQHRKGRPASEAIRRPEERVVSRGHRHGAVHQPSAEGRRAHCRCFILPRRRGDFAGAHARAAQSLLRRREQGRRFDQRGFLQVRAPRRGAQPRAPSSRTSCCAPSSATSTSTTTTLTLFERAYDWMKARGMTEGQSEHAQLVVS